MDRNQFSVCLSLLTCAIWVTCFLPATVQAQNLDVNLYAVLTEDPGSVVLVNASTLKPVATIPLLSKDKVAFAMLVPGGELYVFHNADACVKPFEVACEPRNWSGPSSITVVDLANRRVIKTIQLGWNVLHVLFSQDGRRLVAFSMGRLKTKPKPDEEAWIHVIDTRTHELVNSYALGPFAQRMLATPDLERILVDRSAETTWGYTGIVRPDLMSCWATTLGRKTGNYEVTLIDPERPEPAGKLTLSTMTYLKSISPDGRWGYVVDCGLPDRNTKRHKDGQIYVIDLKDNTLALTYPVGAMPRIADIDAQTGVVTIFSHASAIDHSGQMHRLKGKELIRNSQTVREPLAIERYSTLDRPVLLAKDEICLLNKRDEIEAACVPFSLEKQLHMEKSASDWLYFGRGIDKHNFLISKKDQREFLQIEYAPSLRQLLLHYGSRDQKLAIVPLDSGDPISFLSVGRREVKRDEDFLSTLKIFGSVGLLLLGCSGGYCGSPVLGPTRVEQWPASSLVVSSNGNYAYVRNDYTHDVTVINLETRAIERYFELGGPGGGLAISHDGKQLWAYSRKRVIVIDTAKNDILWQAAVADDIRQIAPPDQSGVVATLTEKELLIFDSEHKAVRKAELGNARFFLNIGTKLSAADGP